MSRRHAIFDQASLGPDLEILEAGQVVGVTDDNIDLARTARANIGKVGKVSRFEVIVWPAGPQTEQDIMEARVGLVTADHPNTVAVGEDEHSIGYDLATGNIRYDATTLATVDPAMLRDVVGIRLDLDLQQVVIQLNGAQQYVADISGSGWAGVTWYPAVSLGSQAHADLRAFLNTGQRGFQFPDPLSEGWYDITTSIDAIWLASEDWISKPTDLPPNQPATGCIPLSAAAFTRTRSLSFWPQGDNSVTPPDVGALTILDPSGQFDELISGSVRDLPVQVLETSHGAALEDAETVGTFVVDRVEAVDDMTKRLIFKDRTVILDNPITNNLFPPSAEEGAANRIVPITYGFGLSIAPTLYRIIGDSSGDTRQYKVNDQSLLGIGFFRDRGDILESAGSDPVYYISADFQGVDLLVNPAGKLTIDVSSVGGDVPTPPTNLVPSTLGSWDASDNVTQGSGEYTFSDGLTINSGRVEAYLQMSGVLGSMVTYRYQFTINSMTAGNPTSGQFTKLQILRDIGPSNEPELILGISINGPITTPTTYTGTFSNFSAGTNNLIFAMVGTQSPFDELVMDDDIRVYEVDNSEVTSDNLLPMPLADFTQAILQDRAGFSAAEWGRASAEYVDAASGATGIGWHTSEQVPIRQALQDVLPSYGCCLAQNRNGILTIYRIEAPETMEAESPSLNMGVIDSGDMLSDLRIDTDEATGLTNRFGLQPNETVLDPTDFVDDFDPTTGVPLSVRIKLSRKYREILGTGSVLASPTYNHAYSAPELGTRFLRIVDAQAELNRICAIYAVERKFYTVEVPLTAPYDLGQLWTLVYPRYGLSGGKPVVIWRIVEDRIARRCTLTLWG